MCLTLSNILDVLKTSYLHTNNVKLSHHVITVTICVLPGTFKLGNRNDSYRNDKITIYFTLNYIDNYC